MVLQMLPANTWIADNGRRGHLRKQKVSKPKRHKNDSSVPDDDEGRQQLVNEFLDASKLDTSQEVMNWLRTRDQDLNV